MKIPECGSWNKRESPDLNISGMDTRLLAFESVGGWGCQGPGTGRSNLARISRRYLQATGLM